MNYEFRNNCQAKTPKVPSSRRSFLRRAAGASALAVPTLTLITSRESRAGHGKKLTGLNAELIMEVQGDEDQHVPIIQNLLDDPDNPLPVPIRQPPNLNMARLKQPNLQAFLETAAAFENTGSGLYHGALLNVTQTQEYFPTAAGLAAVEARHAAWLNSLLGQSLVEDFAPVEAPITSSSSISSCSSNTSSQRSTT
jgi:Ferritin-like domain